MLLCFKVVLRYLHYFALFIIVFSFHKESFAANPSNPIVFVTQVPLPYDFATINSVFGNHRASIQESGRGGDLYIRYTDGSLKNLTLADGYGTNGLQGASSIQVRDPSVHWNGSKVIFSMLIGAPTQRYQADTYYWQLYEITNLAKTEVPIITKVPNQPNNFNNVMPTYGTEDQIIFASDRPRNGAANLYPQRDEYESTPTNSGLWSLNSEDGDLFLLDHSPSGDFHPIIDSFGRVIFTRWDHLQRDQQNVGASYGAFNYSSEETNASLLSNASEFFPEPRADDDPDVIANVNRHTINQFFPWQMHEDGTELETLNHIGRQELHDYLSCSFNDDPNVEEFYGQYSRFNQNSIENFLHIREDPTASGIYYGIDAPEFSTHASGQIIKINGSPSIAADQMSVTYVTHRDTASYTDSPGENHSGLYRNPLPISNGTLIAAHTTSSQADQNIGTTALPQSRYSFRIKTLKVVNNYYVPDQNLTSGITKTVSYWDPDTLISYPNVTMWELQPVELVARTRPSKLSIDLPSPEKSIFNELGITEASLKDYLIENNLALLVSRDVTTRDKADKQQPLNLKVTGTDTKTVAASGKIYNISNVQFFQGDLIRGYGGISDPESGRRVLANVMHDPAVNNPANSQGPQGSVKIESDGSMAAFVPARRALTWHMTDENDKAVVRERYWLTFQPGEVRVCASCHGVNSLDQAGQAAPVNPPEALRTLLQHWKGLPRTTPTFNILVSAKNKKGANSGKKLLAGGNVTLTVNGGLNREITLKLKINNMLCSKPIAKFNTGQDGTDTLIAKVPTLAGSAQLAFQVIYAGEVVKTSKAKFNGSKGNISASVAKNLCKKFKKALE